MRCKVLRRDNSVRHQSLVVAMQDFEGTVAICGPYDTEGSDNLVESTGKGKESKLHFRNSCLFLEFFTFGVDANVINSQE